MSKILYISLWPFHATTGSHKSRTTVLAAMLPRPFAGQVMRRGRADGTAAPRGSAEDLMGAGTPPSDTSVLGNAEAWPWPSPLGENKARGLRLAKGVQKQGVFLKN